MEFYSKDFEVDIHDVDFNGVARMSSLMRYIQSTAQSQLTDNNLSYDKMKDMKRAFILSRIKMEFTEPVRAYQKVRGITFPAHSHGASFIRCYELMRDGIAIGRAVSIWALINTETHALVKVNDFDMGLTTYEPLDYALTRFSLPKELEEVGTFDVTYASVDQNRHMNNTKYPDVYSHFLPLKSKRIEEISINYVNEAPLADTLRVLSAKNGEYYYFRTLRSDGKVNSEAEVRLADII